MASSSIPLTGKKRQQAIKLLFAVADILDQHNIIYHLEGGTLLGIVRDKDLIPWDTDIDISIPADRYKDAIKALKKLPVWQWRIRHHNMQDNGPAWKKGDPRIIKVKSRNPLIPLLPGDLCLDIFIKHFDKDYAYWQAGCNIMRIDKSFHQGFDTVEFNHKKLKAPHEHQQYLAIKYGDWKTPQQAWHYSNEGTVIQ